MPRAKSSAIAPVGITSTGGRPSSPRRMTAPLPNWRSMWARAVSRAFSRSLGVAMVSPSGRCRPSAAGVGCLVVETLSGAPDNWICSSCDCGQPDDRTLTRTRVRIPATRRNGCNYRERHDRNCRRCTEDAVRAENHDYPRCYSSEGARQIHDQV